ncbi:MAG: hypothetical protein M3N24_01905 [Actinomycetota bacterium]|nr:hypothetical protein [Actinomycetota bacterium]
MEGIYRIRGGGQDLVESFVAAPGPAGWRYFGRIHAPDSEEELSTVDFVVDTDWALVRYRERHRQHGEVVVVRGPTGLEATWIAGESEATAHAPDAQIVWSSSPCSRLVAERRARAVKMSALPGLGIALPEEPRPVSISLDRMGFEAANGRRAERIHLQLDGASITALVREDLPIFAEGWFELIR